MTPEAVTPEPVTPEPGLRAIGPTNGDLLVHTTCEGAMARMGHNLTLLVEQWDGTLNLGDSADECSVEIRANLHSLKLRESSGGAKPAAPGDEAKIEKNAAGAFSDPDLHFTSTSVRGDWNSGELLGRLTINGQTREQQFRVTAVDSGFRLTGEVQQTRFGLKPFSAMMGALKVADTVTVEAWVAV